MAGSLQGSGPSHSRRNKGFSGRESGGWTERTRGMMLGEKENEVGGRGMRGGGGERE